MAESPRYQRRRRDRRVDVIKVKIEDVNLNGAMGPMAQGRDPKDHGLFDIDLSHSVGSAYPLPTVGEIWWIERGGRSWILSRKVDTTRTPPSGGGGGGSTDNRSGIPQNVDLSFNVREKKTALEYEAFVTFDAVTTDANGDPQETASYVIDWVPCTKAGNIITDEKVRQHLWAPNDSAIDDPLDPAADYYVILPGNVPRPKVWYWKARVRAVSDGGHKGAWSDWTVPTLPIKDSLPEPPAPTPTLGFRWKDTAHQPIFSAEVRFDDVNYWDIPGFDYEDDISSYEVMLQPLQRALAWVTSTSYRKGDAVTRAGVGYICIKAHTASGANQPANATFWDPAANIVTAGGSDYIRADPQGDGSVWANRMAKVKDKDSTDDTFVTLGTLAEDITNVDTTFDVDETGVVGSPSVPFIVKTNTAEKWLVYSRTLVAGSTYTYEVYRQFNFTPDALHSTGAALTWLKDPYRYKVDFHHIERPRTVYWRTRVRSKDRFSRIGPWSSWTDPVTPWSSIDFQVPVPLNLKGHIEIRDYKTHPEFKLTATFKDPAPNGWNIPGGDLQDDVDHYLVVAEAIVPDPDGYIESNPQLWDDAFSYSYNDIVEWNGGRYRSLTTGNLNNEPPNGAFWVPTTDRRLFRIPDRRIGVLKAPSGLYPADTSMTVTLDSDLPPSIIRLLDDVDKRTTYLRILTPGAFVDDPDTLPIEEAAVSEVVGTTLQTAVAGQDRTYTIERMQKGSFDWGHNDGDEVYILTEHLRRAHVDDKDKDDPGHFHFRYHVNLGRVSKAKQHYWHIRARSVDTFGHKSEWTRWTQPINPSSDPDLIIDAPDYVALDFDRVHRDRWTRWRAIVEFSEVHYNAPDGDREEDVTRYAVQLATTDGDELDVEILPGETAIQVFEKRRQPGNTPFFILIDDEIMEVTNRVNVADKLWTYTVVRAQKGTTEGSYHPQGARIYEYPFLHHTVSAKNDDDRNNYNRAIFPKAQRFRHYKARVKAHDRYNRNSEWTPWTPEGTPSDSTPPPPPTNVLIDVDNHKIVANWDYEADPDDTDPDLPGASDEAAYFQTQLSDDNFATIHKFDRYVAATHKTFRVKKPGMGTWYIRVRAVDGSGNKSAWVTDSGAQNGVPTPDAPTLTFDIDEGTKHIRAIVLLDPGVLGIDDDVDGYEFQLQPASFKKLRAIAHRLDVHIYVKPNSSNLPSIPFVAHIQKERIRVTHTNTVADKWVVIRGVGTSVPTKHAKNAKVQYFKTPGGANDPRIRRQKTGEEAEAGDPVLTIFHNVQRGLVYRARVRAHNTKGLWGNWSAWSRG